MFCPCLYELAKKIYLRIIKVNVSATSRSLVTWWLVVEWWRGRRGVPMPTGVCAVDDLWYCWVNKKEKPITENKHDG